MALSNLLTGTNLFFACQLEHPVVLILTVKMGKVVAMCDVPLVLTGRVLKKPLGT